MTDDVSAAECLAELPNVAHGASEAVLELYAAIRQARECGATWGQLSSATGLARSSVRDVVAGKLPRFAVG